MTFKIFDLYDTKEVKISDGSLEPYINLDDKIIVKFHGRNFWKFDKYKAHVLERLANRVGVLVSLKSGQNFYWKAKKLEEKSPQKKFFYLVAHDVDLQRLEDWPFIEVSRLHRKLTI